MIVNDWKNGVKCKANQILFSSSQRGLVSNGFELAGFHNFSQEILSRTPKVVTSCAEGGSLEAKRSGNREKTQTTIVGRRGFAVSFSWLLYAAQRFKVRTKPVPPARYASFQIPKESGALKSNAPVKIIHPFLTSNQQTSSCLFAEYEST